MDSQLSVVLSLELLHALISEEGVKAGFKGERVHQVELLGQDESRCLPLGLVVSEPAGPVPEHLAAL